MKKFYKNELGASFPNNPVFLLWNQILSWVKPAFFHQAIIFYFFQESSLRFNTKQPSFDSFMSRACVSTQAIILFNFQCLNLGEANFIVIKKRENKTKNLILNRLSLESSREFVTRKNMCIFCLCSIFSILKKKSKKGQL